MQLIHEHLGKSYIVGSREYQEMMFGRPQNLKIITDESGEVSTFYRHPEDADRNGQLIKSLRDRYPGQPLLKYINRFEEEMLLKSRPVLIRKESTHADILADLEKMQSRIKKPAKRVQQDIFDSMYG